jgi:hypothetical protein
MLGMPSIKFEQNTNSQDSKTEDCLKSTLHPDLLATKDLSCKPLDRVGAQGYINKNKA